MNYLSLFSGIGGFEHGIETSTKADHLHCIGYSEIDKYAKKVYKKHYPNHTDLGDATKIKTENLPTFDLLVGGFPCQAFSVAGKRRGFDDTRGTLFFEIARILKAKKPRYFLLENVKGLLSHDKGKTFQTILGTLSELGYDVLWEIFNSKNHGVPQNRERLYIKGFLRERCAGEILSLRDTGTTIKTQQEKNNEIVRIGNLFEQGGQAGQVYDSEGLSTTISANGGGMGGKTGLYKISTKRTKKSPRIKKVGNVSKNGKSQSGIVYDATGLSPTLLCRDFKDPVKVKVKKVGNINPSGKGQSGNVYDSEGLSPTLTSSDYKSSTKIIENKDSTTNGSEQKNNNKEDLQKLNLVGNLYPKDNPQSERIYDSEGLSPTIQTGGSGEKILLRNNTQKGYAEAREGDGFVYGQYNCRGRVQKQSVPTLNTGDSSGAGVIDNFKIRRLTPLECEKLQGFPDQWTLYGEDGSTMSDTQRYKMCGNAVTVNVIRHIFDTWNLTLN